MPHTPVKVDKREDFLVELQSFMQNKGFIWGPFPEIYGGVAGFYSYGPMGKLLKDKVERVVRRTFQSNGMWEVECPIVVPDIVWEASGHLTTFTDPVIYTKDRKESYRVDKLLEENNIKVKDFSDKGMLDLVAKHNVKAPSGKDLELKIIRQSLMMKTKVAGDFDASLRPETATVTYLPFKKYYEFFRRKLPFGVFQIGKAFRNEISPRQSLLRLREFTQAEGQFFVDPSEENSWERFEPVKNNELPLWDYKSQKSDGKQKTMSVGDALKKKYFTTKAYAWCVWLAYKLFLNMGIPENRIRVRQHDPDEKAFYAKDAWDIEINLNSFGWTEVCGVHDRTDYDLKQHSKYSKEHLTAKDEKNNELTPHILEIAFGIDRPVFALLDLFYSKIEKEEGKTSFKVPYHLAPVDVGIFPLMKKDGLPEVAVKIKHELENEFVVEYDESGSIGRRYLRAAEVGTPYCITVDYDSLKDKDATVRDRDSEKQKRVKIIELNQVLRKLLNKEIAFEKI